LDDRYYRIANVASDAAIILQESYVGPPLTNRGYQVAAMLTDLRIENLSVVNLHSTGTGAIDFRFVLASAVRNCDLRNNHDYGIGLNETHDCEIAGNSCSRNTQGVYLAMGFHNRVSGNVCRFNCQYGVAAIAALKSVLSANVCSNNEMFGMLVSGDYSTLTGNSCNSNGQGGMDIGGDTNAVHGNVCGQNQFVGIHVNEGEENAVVGNSLVDNGEYGVAVSTFMMATNNLVGMNILTGNSVGAGMESPMANTRQTGTNHPAF
jgi:parallel beta-helix repeat protein